MSEFSNYAQQQKQNLADILRQLHSGRSVDDLKAQFGEFLKRASTDEIAEAEQALLAEGMPVDEVRRLCDLHVAIFEDSLDSQEVHPEMLPGHPIYTFKDENQVAERVLQNLEIYISRCQSEPNAENFKQALEWMHMLMEYDVHFIRKENILFPILERYNFTGPTKVMWGVQNDIRVQWKALAQALAGSDAANSLADITSMYNELATAVRGMFYKEDHILFPNALQRLTPEDWSAIYNQEDKEGFFRVSRGELWQPYSSVEVPNVEQPTQSEVAQHSGIPLKTGYLSPEQIQLMLTHLPVDITYVDENDKVLFYSETPARVFPRSPAIIGRSVQNCHPPQSVDRVQLILDDFRAGKRDTADFWIQMQGKFIVIRYYALRDEKGVYNGTLEVTQEINDLRALEGERRILDEAAG
jgi:DUF438 domain-containing protein